MAAGSPLPDRNVAAGDWRTALRRWPRFEHRNSCRARRRRCLRQGEWRLLPCDILCIDGFEGLVIKAVQQLQGARVAPGDKETAGALFFGPGFEVPEQMCAISSCARTSEPGRFECCRLAREIMGSGY